MAKVTITIEDLPDGKTDVHMESVPGWPGPAAKDQYVTEAQAIGSLFLDFLRKHMGDQEE